MAASARAAGGRWRSIPRTVRLDTSMPPSLIRMGRTDEGTSEMQVFQRLQADAQKREDARSSWDG